MSAPADFPLFLAPMAGVTDTVFRRLCKGFGADVLTTEFVSAEGILHRNDRTEEFVTFDPEIERPLGVQLFGGDPGKMAEAARAVLDWKQPDFIDLNFGCPVNKVVAKNGGSSLLRDCPLLERVASTVVRAVAEHAPGVPVTAKIRVGWDEQSVNAPQVARILEGCGIQRLAVHGRTRAQGYSGEANWDVIAATAAAVPGLPVIGNGDLASAEMIAHRRVTAGVAGVMIGRAAMGAPWLFHQAKTFLATGTIPPAPDFPERWALIRAHCAEAVARRRHGGERAAMSSMRARLMAYTRGMEGGPRLRERLAHVVSLAELDDIAAWHLLGGHAVAPLATAA